MVIFKSFLVFIMGIENDLIDTHYKNQNSIIKTKNGLNFIMHID